jgi:hypothetical protein
MQYKLLLVKQAETDLPREYSLLVRWTAERCSHCGCFSGDFVQATRKRTQKVIQKHLLACSLEKSLTFSVFAQDIGASMPATARSFWDLHHRRLYKQGQAEFPYSLDIR